MLNPPGPAFSLLETLRVFCTFVWAQRLTRSADQASPNLTRLQMHSLA